MASDPAPDALPRRMHLVGIGGAGMAGLAECLMALGHEVSGSDLRRSAETDRLAAGGARILYEHRAEAVAHAQMVVVSDAVPPDNVELQEARQRDIPVWRRARCLDRLVAGRRTVMVAGSHGKSTTAAMIACVLETAGAAPGFLIGADVPALEGRRARIGTGDSFVVEACEAFQSLALFHPALAVVTNIDDDHLEHYGTQARLDAAFLAFARRAETAIVNGDDPGTARILADLDGPIRFGFGPENHVGASEVAIGADGSRFAVRIEGRPVGWIFVPIPGLHIVADALAAIAACHALGVPVEAMARGLATFTGVERRWQDHGSVAGVRIVDDYAHHPTALAATIAAARAILGPGQRLVVIFQPQLHSRTRRLHRAFAQSLSGADEILLLEVDPGGEAEAGAVGSRLILDALPGDRVTLCDDVEDLLDRAPRGLRPGDLVLVAGAGSIRSAARRLALRLREAEPGPVPPPSSRHWLRATWSRMQAPGTPRSVVDLFRAHAARQPRAAAVIQGARTIDYAALEAMSRGIGGGLVARGIGPGAVVGVSLPPSIELVATMLAIMALGAVYLPLDPGLPEERRRFMREKAGAGLVVAGADLGEVASVHPRDLAGGRPFTGRGPAPDTIAYIAFTSGSTGFPKGVPIAHRGLLAMAADAASRFGIGPGSRMALNTAIGFDVSLGEMWMTLGAGGALQASGAPPPLVGSRLARFLADGAITHLAVTPSVLASMPPQPLPSLACIVAAGEACPQALVDAWAQGRRFFNAYGPTEATIYATAAACRPGKPVTIGTALAHLETHVLDERLEPASVGELALSGIGLAPGYLDLADETRRRFVDLPGTGRVYRTGDLVRREPGGDLVFLGRLDTQVKLRGHRLEIEEVEQAIRRILGFADVAVCVDDHAGAPALVCFVAGAGGPLDRAVLAARLAAWLPEPMLPSHFVRVGTIPLTSSGKTDRRGLLARHRGRIVRRAEYLAPRSPQEAVVVTIWTDILAVGQPIGVYDDFSALGGDSLKSLEVIDAIERRAGISVPPGHFGRFGTVTRMAAQLADLWEDRAAPAEADVPGFRGARLYRRLRDLTAGWTGTRVDPGGLIVSLGGTAPAHHLFWCLQEEFELIHLGRHLGPAFAVHGMRSGHLLMDYDRRHVDLLGGGYLEELRQIQPRGPVLLGGTCQGAVIAHAMAQRLGREGRDVGLLFMMEAARPLPFDGHAAFLFAADSFLNPLRPEGPGTAPYEALYGERYSIDIVPGDHGGALRDPAAPYAAAAIQARVAALGRGRDAPA